MARDLQAASGFAIVLIAFIAGLQLPTPPRRPLRALRRSPTDDGRGVDWNGSHVFFRLAMAADRAGAGGRAAGWLPSLAAAVLAACRRRSRWPSLRKRERAVRCSLATGTVVVVQLLVMVLFVIVLEAARVVFDTSRPRPAATIARGPVGRAGFAGLRRPVRRTLRALRALDWPRADARAPCALRHHRRPWRADDLEPLIAGVAAGLVVQLARR